MLEKYVMMYNIIQYIVFAVSITSIHHSFILTPSDIVISILACNFITMTFTEFSEYCISEKSYLFYGTCIITYLCDTITVQYYSGNITIPRLFQCKINVWSLK